MKKLFHSSSFQSISPFVSFISYFIYKLLYLREFLNFYHFLNFVEKLIILLNILSLLLLISFYAYLIFQSCGKYSISIKPMSLLIFIPVRRVRVLYFWSSEVYGCAYDFKMEWRCEDRVEFCKPLSIQTIS